MLLDESPMKVQITINIDAIIDHRRLICTPIHIPDIRSPGGKITEKLGIPDQTIEKKNPRKSTTKTEQIMPRLWAKSSQNMRHPGSALNPRQIFSMASITIPERIHVKALLTLSLFNARGMRDG